MDIAHLVPFGPVSPSGQNVSQDDSSSPMLNTAICHQESSVTNDASKSLDVTPADDSSTLTDIKLGVSVPVSLVSGLSLANATESEPVEPKLEPPVDEPRYSAPPAVNQEALHALEMLLGM